MIREQSKSKSEAPVKILSKEKSPIFPSSIASEIIPKTMMKKKRIPAEKNNHTLDVDSRTDPEIEDVDRLENLCFSEFHKHFNPFCKKIYPLDELIKITHSERRRALYHYEYDAIHYQRKSLLRAIPGMSTVLGGNQWEFTDSYSAEQAMEIYIFSIDLLGKIFF